MSGLACIVFASLSSSASESFFISALLDSKNKLFQQLLINPLALEIPGPGIFERDIDV
jgi:hypothetical protein